MTKPTTPQLTEGAVREIETRANAATSGPWVYDDRHSAVIEQASGGKSWIMQSWSKQEESFVDERENGEFIAHARTDIPALIRDWRALRTENQIAETALKFILPNRPMASISEIAKLAVVEVDRLRESTLMPTAAATAMKDKCVALLEDAAPILNAATDSAAIGSIMVCLIEKVESLTLDQVQEKQ